MCVCVSVRACVRACVRVCDVKEGGINLTAAPFAMVAQPLTSAIVSSNLAELLYNSVPARSELTPSRHKTVSLSTL